MTEHAHKHSLVSPTSGTFNGVAPGSRVFGSSLTLGQLGWPEKDNVSALLHVLAETDTLTVTPIWQVSSDAGATWLDCANGSQNASSVVMATGTGGADSTVALVVGAPAEIYAYLNARISLAVGGTTGATQDTWSISYQLVELA